MHSTDSTLDYLMTQLASAADLVQVKQAVLLVAACVLSCFVNLFSFCSLSFSLARSLSLSPSSGLSLPTFLFPIACLLRVFRSRATPTASCCPCPQSSGPSMPAHYVHMLAALSRSNPEALAAIGVTHDFVAKQLEKIRQVRTAPHRTAPLTGGEGMGEVPNCCFVLLRVGD